jgi:hypothetical protein
MTCKDCIFWEGDKYSNHGVCHRYPRIISHGDLSYYAIADDDDWCGEFVSNDEVYNEA